MNAEKTEDKETQGKKCMTLFALNAERKQKFLLNQSKAKKSIARNVI